MANLILLPLCLMLGIVFQRVKAFPVNAHKALNAFIIYVALPALTLLYIPSINLNKEIIFPVMLAWLVLAGAVLFILLVSKMIGIEKATVGCLILCSGLGNTAFVGFPVLEALYGADGLKTGIILDQAGTFLAVSTVGIMIAAIFSAGDFKTSTVVRKVFTFPPFGAFVIAIILNIAGYEHQPIIAEALAKLGSTIAVLALVSVGLQLKPDFRAIKLKHLLIGLSYKLMLAPALIYLLYVVMLGQQGKIIDVCIMEAAMAPMVTATIVASDNNLNPPLANMMVGVGIPLSAITLTFWYYFL